MSKIKQNKLLLLVVFSAILLTIFTVWGLNSRNIDFFLPRRLIKVGTIVLISFCIGYSSVVFQTITNNRILTPGVMGLDSLYLFIQTFVVYAFGSRQLAMMTGYTEFFLSIGIMIGVSCLLFLVLFRGDVRNIYYLVLVGMIFGTLFSGMSTFMQVLLDPNEFLVLQGKMFASFNNVNNGLFGICVVIVMIVGIISYRDYKYLDVISLGEEHAINLGVPYKKVVLRTLISVSVLISISTALVGPITFLGILLVSLSREFMKTYRHTKLVMGAVLIGCILLTAGLIFVEKVLSFSTSLSVIVNFVGGIYFIYQMMKESKT
ncbi:iron compound ABC uptake transporter permease protein [Lachnospiraceae bacterium KM106-2]|nr:iron compound ABC uptake transporter permease protein [Lachnospiraceae bacterium KM106-2]